MNTGDFMKKVFQLPVCTKDREIVSIERVYTPSTFYMQSSVAQIVNCVEWNIGENVFMLNNTNICFFDGLLKGTLMYDRFWVPSSPVLLRGSHVPVYLLLLLYTRLLLLYTRLLLLNTCSSYCILGSFSTVYSAPPSVYSASQ